jgi:hypothetical protein
LQRQARRGVRRRPLPIQAMRLKDILRQADQRVEAMARSPGTIIGS